MATARRFALWCAVVGFLWLVGGFVLMGVGIIGQEEDTFWSGLGALFLLSGVLLFGISSFFFGLAGRRKKDEKKRLREWRP